MEPESTRMHPIAPAARPGRPRLLAPAYEAELARMAGLASTNGVHGRHYAMVAVRALFDLEQPGWVPRDEAFTHFVKRNGDLKWSMLSELGRSPMTIPCAPSRGSSDGSTSPRVRQWR